MSRGKLRNLMGVKSVREIDFDDWVPIEESVLCFVRKRLDRQVLLIYKKTGLGAGLINAPGGRIERGETPEEAAVREAREEVSIDVEKLSFSGNLYFQFTNGHSIRGYVFQTETWFGKPLETAEATPFWCGENSIPYDKMWVDDELWLPQLLADRYFSGRFVFDDQTAISMSLEVEASMENHIQADYAKYRIIPDIEGGNLDA